MFPYQNVMPFSCGVRRGSSGEKLMMTVVVSSYFVFLGCSFVKNSAMDTSSAQHSDCNLAVLELTLQHNASLSKAHFLLLHTDQVQF